MANFKIVSDTFIDVYEREVERSTKRNIKKLDTERIIKLSHDKIVAMLKHEKQDDNKYLDFNVYKSFVEEQREVRKQKDLERKQKKELEEKQMKIQEQAKK